MQKGTNEAAYELLKFYSSIIGGGNFQCVYIIMRAIFITDIDSIVLILNTSTVVLMINTLKLFHASPRPSWESSEVQTYKCYSEFGSPSGHTMLCTNFCMYVYFVYVLNENNKVYKMLRSVLSDQAIRFSSIAILSISTYYMGYSRIVLGAHSINQVLYGFLLGLWTAVWVLFIVRKTLLLHLADIRDRKLAKSEAKYFVGWIISIIVFMNAI